ncbi:MAG: hypothetical protein QOI53_3225 [Verrucomicrobiota bacterium]|jgi:hypothetical protein|nr:hypothetical protein [Verrucomicrobiota bacterium]
MIPKKFGDLKPSVEMIRQKGFPGVTFREQVVSVALEIFAVQLAP